MPLHLLLLLVGAGAVSSSSLPRAAAPRRQNGTRHAVIDEMLCLLEAEKEPINERFSRPIHIKSKSCAHYNTESFIHELRKIPRCKCMKRVEKDMEWLEKNCPLLKKSPPSDELCRQKAQSGFLRFKETLEEFLKWVNGKRGCRSGTGARAQPQLEEQCSCPDRGQSRRGLQ